MYCKVFFIVKTKYTACMRLGWWFLGSNNHIWDFKPNQTSLRARIGVNKLALTIFYEVNHSTNTTLGLDFTINVVTCCKQNHASHHLMFKFIWLSFVDIGQEVYNESQTLPEWALEIKRLTNSSLMSGWWSQGPGVTRDTWHENHGIWILVPSASGLAG